ncbi:DUF4439 domain-containing protein [Corynebacterium sp. HS2168-gen11]|uniref:DUF4439 domain-containing protein n=1 Tax=Corynebacterium sp. HS2168-gen11 TaxID=2974027 RepID=UPI00216B503E|nr:DUF4439 domain-containing protein [Corynebacterium sp. HS2168-gen11]MCS4536317.1 DUF4439 domain-containing protein [Corynebacterium sp. HS2168-gen11]
MNRFYSMSILVSLCWCLGACSASPTPEPSLWGLYNVSEGEAKTQLAAEIYRLCGHDEHNAVAPSCQLEQAAQRDEDAPAPIAFANASAAEILAHLAEFPQASMPVIMPIVQQTAQATQFQPDLQAYELQFSEDERLAAAATSVQAADEETVPSTAPALPESDLQWYRTGLSYEYGVLYGLQVSRAYTNPAQDAQIDALIKVHETIIDALETHVATTGATPIPEPGYTFTTAAQPTDAQQAEAFVRELHTTMVNWWLSVPAHVTDPQHRVVAAAIALLLDAHTP